MLNTLGRFYTVDGWSAPEVAMLVPGSNKKIGSSVSRISFVSPHSLFKSVDSGKAGPRFPNLLRPARHRATLADSQ